MSAVESRNASTRAEVLSEIGEIVTRVLTGRGVATPDPASVGIEVADAIADSFGGVMLYIPTDHGRKRAERDATLLHRSHSEPAAALALEFGLSVQAIYKAIKRAQLRPRKRK